MDTTGLILALMIPAMALTMLNLGIGPFGHPRFIRHHQNYKKVSAAARGAIQFLCALILLTGTLQMLGFIDLTSSSTLTDN